MVENRGEKERVEIDLEELENHLKNDLKLIEQYSRLIEKVKIKTNPIEYKDPKLKELKLLLNGYFENGSKIPKILIFSQFKDTVHYIFDKIKEWETITDNANLRNLVIEKVTGGTNTKDKDKIIKKFSPYANDYEPEEREEIDLLFSTDALSEGVKLQDASIIINYDLPWNPMRIVQRVGRANRLGSDNQIFVYNFFPDKDLEALLNLIKKLGDKIENVKNLLAKETKILSEEEEITVDTIGETINNISIVD